MIEFEWYIKRARIDLGLFFKVENINSDEDLAEYCRSKSLSLPKNKYFPEKLEVASEPKVEEAIPAPKETKPARSRRKPKSETDPEVIATSEVVKPKPARKPRKTTRKKATSK